MEAEVQLTVKQYEIDIAQARAEGIEAGRNEAVSIYQAALANADAREQDIKNNCQLQITKAEPLIRADALREVGEIIEKIERAYSSTDEHILRIIESLKAGQMPEVKS